MRTDGPSRTFRNKTLHLAALVLAMLPACSSGESDPGNTTEELMPPPAGKGVQFKMVSTLDPGQEIERCQFLVAPPGGLNINHDEVRYTPGSHHVLLYLTPYTAVPTMDMAGKARDTSGVFDCAQGATADWSVTGVVAGAQSFDGGSMVSLPADTAVKVPAGAVLLMNTHYLNARPTPLTAETRINVYTLPDAEVKQEGGVLFFYNPFISIPGKARASARMRCGLDKDITLTNVQSHMHKRGVGYKADLIDASGKKVEQIYESHDWENVNVKRFEPGMKIPAGSALDYRCEYDNPEDRQVSQGGSTRDEMCMLIGSYYPRRPELEACNDAVFYGSGSKSCQVSAACALGAVASSDYEAMYACVVDSCEAAARPLTDVLMCYFTRGGKACADDCKSGADPVKCNACTMSACQAPMDACRTSVCG